MRGCDPAGPAATCSGSCAPSAWSTRPVRSCTAGQPLGQLDPGIRAYAAANRIELVPTPTYASYLNRIESHFRPIQEFVFNHTDYPHWDTAQRTVADYITHRNGADRDRRIAALERKPSRRMNKSFQVKRLGWPH